MFICDWVNVVNVGKYKITEELVVKIKKWVTFRDITGAQQFRAPYNLIKSDLSASEHDGERYARGGNNVSRERK